MRLIFAEAAWEDYLFWQQTDPRISPRICELIRVAMRHPFEGVGKPKPLRRALAGYWSRHITDGHRMVYKAASGDLLIAQLRCHY